MSLDAAPADDDSESLRFERLVADLCARFVNVPPENVDAAIVDSQRQIVESLDLDRSALFEIADSGELRLTHAWTRPEFGPPVDNLSATRSFPWYSEQIRAGRTVVVPDSREVPSEIDRQALECVGTKSNVVIPLGGGGQGFGALTFATLRAPRPWPERLVGRLRLLADVFSQALAMRRHHEELQAALTEVRQLRDMLSRDNEVLRGELQALRPTHPWATNSAAAKSLLDHIDRVAPTSATVLLEGETGVGKEVVAQAIHDRSPRRHRPMVHVNCGAIPDALIESELFGRERGAFTGAVARQIGRFELADGSTIFLDEVAELPLESQAKLLRVVQDRVVERLGGPHGVKVDVRIIAATNRNLADAVAARTFRDDLYYRLNVYPITVPPLRERAEDVPTLVWSFVDEFTKAYGKTITSVSRADMAALQAYSWPGNIRELRNVIERATIISTGPRLEIGRLAAPVLTPAAATKLADVEAAHISSILASTGWRVRGKGGAADLLGIKPTTLEGRMAKLGIKRPEK
jgi:transcriptional regulator with GAF, ATPase, and Fis domain